MTPVERLRHITGKFGRADLFGSLVNEYEWFLRGTDREKSSVMQWMAENNQEVSRRSSNFGDVIFELMDHVFKKTGGSFRYTVV